MSLFSSPGSISRGRPEEKINDDNSTPSGISRGETAGFLGSSGSRAGDSSEIKSPVIKRQKNPNVAARSDLSDIKVEVSEL